MIEIKPFKAESWPPEQIRQARESFAGLTDQWLIYQALIMETGKAWMAVEDGQPLAAAGAYEIYPGVVHVWALITRQPAQKMAVMLRILARMMPEVCRLYKYRRLQAFVNPNEDAEKLARFVGLKFESVMPGFGIDGRDWHLYGRVL